MEYVANPVEVDAFRITAIEECPRPTISELNAILNEGKQPLEGLILTLEDGQKVNATPEMTARMLPTTGDYWVIQKADGYIYLNPKDVFERKYRPKHRG